LRLVRKPLHTEEVSPIDEELEKGECSCANREKDNLISKGEARLPGSREFTGKETAPN